VALFDPARHEPLAARAWDEQTARAWISGIADDAHRRFDAEALWPAHPLDLEDRPPGRPFTSLYEGAAGVIAALETLAARGYAARGRDYADIMVDLVARNARDMARERWGTESYLIGQSGVLLLAYRVTRSPIFADAVAVSVERNASHPANELLWGVPGTMHVALAMHEWTGEARWADAYRAGASSLASSFVLDRDLQCRLWMQDLYGARVRYLGAAHGFCGNAQAVLRGAHLLDDETRAWWRDEIVATTVRTVARDGAHANWPAGLPVRHPQRWYVQWCHGAPGFVTSLAGLDDARLDDVLAAAGALVFDAGPLTKGGGLCHGTGGNGWALLKLYGRTRESLWLERARAFAMHAIAQCDAHARQHGHRRYSLWTGDAGAALFVAACIDEDDRLPSVEAEPY
jgi:hypothetical protein